MLTGRWNRLKFDDYSSEWFQLDNSIMQGDLLSMILYLFYNTDLNIGCGQHKFCLGYVDDPALVAMASNFMDTHRLLNSMITWPEGAGDWSTSHNSNFEASKLVLLDFLHAMNVSHRAHPLCHYRDAQSLHKRHINSLGS